MSFETHGIKEATHFHVRKRFLAYVDDATKIQFAVYSLLGDPFLSSAGKKMEERGIVSTFVNWT
jgi:hypothetical protein